MFPPRKNRSTSLSNVDISTVAERLLSDLGGHLVKGEWRSICPFHQGAENPTSFHISPSGAWRCYSCGTKGATLTEFVHLRTGVTIAAARQIIDNLPKKFRYVDDLLALLDEQAKGPYKVLDERRLDPYRGGLSAYLLDRGFSADTLMRYEVGYDYSAEKIVLPCRDVQGRLVGFTFRQDGHTEHLWPKYKHESFTKTQHVYGAHLARRHHGDAYVVEGQLDAQRVTQLGAVGLAIMGSYISDAQVDIIASLPASRIMLAHDNDQAGQQGRAYAVKKMRSHPGISSRLWLYEYPRKDPGELEALAEGTHHYWLDYLVLDPLKRMTHPRAHAIIRSSSKSFYPHDRKPVRKRLVMLKRGAQSFQEPRSGGRSGGSSNQRTVKLQPGESALLRFYGDANEYPVLVDRHYVKRLPQGQQYIICAGDNCVTCDASVSDRGVGRASGTAIWWAKDYTLQHKLDTVVRVPKGNLNGRKPGPTDYYETKYPPCATMHKRPCAYCNQGFAPIARGTAVFQVSRVHAEDLLTLSNTKVREFCRSCCASENGEGTLSVYAYSCQHCGSEVTFYPDTDAVASCAHCNWQGAPVEHLACSNCENPERAVLEDFIVRVTRQGEGTNTRYTFALQVPPSPLSPEEREEIEKYLPDWERLYAPPSPAAVAALLGVPNIHGQPAAPQPPPRPHGTVSYNRAALPPGGPPRPQLPPAPAAPPRAAPRFKPAAPKSVEVYDIPYDEDAPYLGHH